MGLSLSLMHSLLHCHQASIIALVAMVLPSLMRRHLCSPGIFAIVVITLFPLLQLHCCCCQAGVATFVTMASSPLSICRRLCSCHDGVAALVALVPLPTLHGHCCPYCTGIIFIILLAFLPSCCMGVVTVVAPALLPPLSWRVCAVDCGYNYLKAATVCQLTVHMDSISMCSNTLLMLKMDGESSLSWLSASNMT